jgi:hypothetical protein
VRTRRSAASPRSNRSSDSATRTLPDSPWNSPCNTRHLYDEYTTEQLQLLLLFVKRGRELDERRAAEVERDSGKSS